MTAAQLVKFPLRFTTVFRRTRHYTLRIYSTISYPKTIPLLRQFQAIYPNLKSCLTFRIMQLCCAEECQPLPNIKWPPLVDSRPLIQYIRSYSSYREAVSAIRNLITLHTVVIKDATLHDEINHHLIGFMASVGAVQSFRLPGIFYIKMYFITDT
jgi:hypothetical protein